MAMLDRAIWPARLSTFALAALAAASVVYWGLRWSEPLTAPPSSGVRSEPRPIDTARVALLLGASASPADAGAAAPTVNAAANYKLEGVIAQGRSSGRGSALIAIGGEKAKPYRVGDHLSDDLLLQSVSARGAALAPGMAAPASIQLELPPLDGLKP
ncbi:type II secretion system protein N [Rhodoferax sp.]|uniref:type II secretion system protein N n=1 Tax=Rhodoferax sp. TaxID=50421 RepID=UPI00260AA0DD|nr:type II secretion system protein N [Rhodoferax sp.]MDD2918195.1 type II secretion system protein N [Rhodoferax sp.]